MTPLSGETAPPSTGTSRTIGRYVLYDEIAAGGMATVHFGRIVGAGGFSRPVAIKRLHPQFARDPEFVAMFLDEARLASKIFHPNVVAPLDVVQDGQEILLVMEYIRGASLSRLIRGVSATNEHLPPKLVASIVSNLLHGLHAAHEAKGDHGEKLGIVHRDVSPQNVLVGTDGVSRVLDFGVAKAAGRMQSTREGQLKGKIAYMAPEQIRGEGVDRRTDIYSAAVVLWEALCTQRLFRGENEVNAITKVLAGIVSPPSTVVSGIPESFDAVVAKGLHLDPDQRYGTAREMAVDLEKCVGIASPTEIGEWVEKLAADELTERATRLAEIERSGSSWSTRAMHPPPPVAVPSDAETRVQALGAAEISSASSASVVRPIERSRPAWLIPLIAAAGVFALILGVVVIGALLRKKLGTPVSAATDTVSVTATAPVTVTATAAAGTAAATATATIAATATATATAKPTSVSVDTLPTSKPTVAAVTPTPNPTTPNPTPTPTPTASTKKPPSHGKDKDCNPNFTTDDKGHVHFKPQCM